MLWDTHMHCLFSGDSTADPEEMILAAISKKLTGICFTDHIDFDYPGETSFVFDPFKYFQVLEALKETYQNKININIGVELGLQPHLKKRYDDFLALSNFDFIIGSSHVVHGLDPYYPDYYENKTEDAAYLEYFESILENLSATDSFDIYGHIDYVVRYGPNKNLHYSYARFKDVIDEILHRIVAMDKGIEINTAGFKYGLGHPNPTEEILARYREIGGEIITIGADAHKPEHVGYEFEKAAGILKAAGFSYYTVFTKRKPEFLPL